MNLWYCSNGPWSAVGRWFRRILKAMWRFKAPLSGRSGEIRSTDGLSRLNISVTLFPNCVVVPEAGTAVRAKQSGAELWAAQFMEYIFIRRSHMVSQFYQLRNGAVSIVPEFCTWHLVFSHLQSVYLPFILSLSFRQSSSCVFLSHFSSCPPSSAHSLGFFSSAQLVCCTHFHRQHCPVCAQVLHPRLALTWSLSTHTQFRTWAPGLRLNFPSHPSALRPSPHPPAHLTDTFLLRTLNP